MRERVLSAATADDEFPCGNSSFLIIPHPQMMRNDDR